MFQLLCVFLNDFLYNIEINKTFWTYMYTVPAENGKFTCDTLRCVYRFAWAAAAGDLGLNVASTTPETFRAAVLAAEDTPLSPELITLARQALIHFRDYM